ncbi:hypothetical protein M427DRAFT_44248 [Gonapodya prolifera JEL478]|uniref:Uncharacterized protein n=1 Tax=Gonapodya prolifera (strain JEL478) TaxID=1344416 RepID=A0A139AGF6_GONPJ|nr:hypothetical protein M427DRAFT_44248 [Gonapodya prolifera JEL478]|eukprot:KXS15891.1 hypothetical protein M427DRAFT_44248 [Gonapodya prolifera JEL478]
MTALELVGHGSGSGNKHSVTTEAGAPLRSYRVAVAFAVYLFVVWELFPKMIKWQWKTLTPASTSAASSTTKRPPFPTRSLQAGPTNGSSTPPRRSPSVVPSSSCGVKRPLAQSVQRTSRRFSTGLSRSQRSTRCSSASLTSPTEGSVASAMKWTALRMVSQLQGSRIRRWTYNKLTLITPDGSITFSNYKSHPVPAVEWNVQASDPSAKIADVQIPESSKTMHSVWSNVFRFE